MSSSDPGAARLHILVIHGPNLNTLGRREPGIYGRMTLAQINERIVSYAAERNCEITIFQSNHEGDLIDFLQQEAADCAGIVINPGGLAHTSVSLRDAVAGTGKPAVEVHLSNIFAREPFRHTSLLSAVCRGHVSGLGWRGYLYALDALITKGADSPS